jgi:ATP-dependent DNA ligase
MMKGCSVCGCCASRNPLTILIIYELKLDGFRGVAHVKNGVCRLESRNGYTFKKWDLLRADITSSLKYSSAILDGVSESQWSA